MMEEISNIVSLIFIIGGVFFLAIAAIGFMRFPDLFCRLHVTGVIDTLGVPLILLGVAIQMGPTLNSGKLVLAIIFMYCTTPLVGHLLARTALKAGRSEGFKPYDKVGTVELESEQLINKYRYLK